MAYTRVRDQLAYGREHYRKNAAVYKKRAKAHTARVRVENRKYIFDFLSNHACVDCGEADTIVLEFDHRDPSNKRFDIGSAQRRGYALATIIVEIEKCDVRCANCHRRKTHRDRLAGKYERRNAHQSPKSEEPIQLLL